MTDSDFDHEGIAEAGQLLRAAVDCALSSDDFAAALGRFRTVLPEAAPRLMAATPPSDDALRAISFAMLREVWRVLPRPDRGWRPLPLPKVERNAPCPCGSGRKFKQCCGAGANPSFFSDTLSVLGYVLDRVPAHEFARLPFRQMAPEELAHVASEWIDEDRHEDAIALLEPLLAETAKLDARHEEAFDVLCGAYLDLGRDDERAALVAAMLKAPDRELRSAALHRRCTMLADAGDYADAWQVFREAQRGDPDNPSLAHLELVLLASQGEAEQLAARARFWAARLRRLGFDGERLVDFVDEVARDPEAFVRTMAGEETGEPDSEALERLLELAEALPAPASHYRLQPADNSAGPLTAEPPLAALEQEWEDLRFVQTGVWRDTSWVEWMASHPLAWQSFSILGDIVEAIDEYPFDDEQEGDLLDDIEDAVLNHAVSLLRRVIADNGADGLQLEWGWMENRAALSLLARRIEADEGTKEELPLLEWLVLTLNPSDNHGFREHLVHVYAAAEKPTEALTVCDRYADDAMGAMLYGRVLALQLLDRRDDATAALATAKELSPRILKTLLAARPKAPDMQPGIITLGGEDEAWRYRMRWRSVWQATGALTWLKQAAGAGR